MLLERKNENQLKAISRRIYKFPEVEKPKIFVGLFAKV